MNEKTQNAAGGRFEKLLKERWSETQVSFVRETGVKENHSQKLTLWKKRGVPSKYANKAALLLSCDPSEISSVEITPTRQPQRKLSDGHAMLVSVTGGMGHDDLAQVIAFAVQLKSGSASTPAGRITNLESPNPEIKVAQHEIADTRAANAEHEARGLLNRRKLKAKSPKKTES